MRGPCGGRAASGLEGWALASGDHTLASAGMALPETPGSWQGAGVTGSGEPSLSSPEGPRPLLTAGPGPPHVPEQTIGLGTGARRGCGAFGGGGLRLCPQGSLRTPARQGPRGWRSPGFHPVPAATSQRGLRESPGGRWGPTQQPPAIQAAPGGPSSQASSTVPASGRRVCQSPFRRGGLSLL